LRKKAALIFFLRFVRLAFAVFNLSLSAKYFGISFQRDVWLLSLNSMIIFDMAIWGPLNETFRAKFLFIKEEEGEEQALKKARAVLLFTNVITLLLVALLVIFTSPLSSVIAPGYQQDQLNGLIFMIRILAPSLLISQITRLMISLLNSYNSFIIPEVSAVFAQVITLVLIVSLTPSIGILSLAISYYAGLFLLLILLAIQISKKKIDLLKNLFQIKLTAVKPFIFFALPFFFPYFAGQLSLIVEKALASSLSVGTLSILDYARKFSDIPLEVLLGVFITMLVPVLSLQFAQNKMQVFLLEFKKMYQFGFLIIIVIVGMLSACPHAFVNILYKKGSISEASLSQISDMTMFYSWAAVSTFLYQIFGAALLSSKNGKTYAFYGVIAQLLTISINLLFYKILSIYVFPFSFLFAHLVSAGLMAYKFPVPYKQLRIITLKYAGLMICIAAVMFFLNHNFNIITNQFWLIMVNVLVLMVLLLSSLVLFKFDERKIIAVIIAKIKRSTT
jgi:putative peptidoglycan lipid II flippase